LAWNRQNEFCANLISLFKNTLKNQQFIQRHRRRPQDFTRQRRLPFSHLFLFLSGLLRSSLATELQRFFRVLHARPWPQREVDPSAVTHARQKLRYTAFVEMNQRILHWFYQQPGRQQWQGLDVRVIDGSTARLPDTPAVCRQYGLPGSRRGRPAPAGRLSFLSDPLNELIIDARLASIDTDERKLLRRQLRCLQPGQLLLGDRGYPAFDLLVLIPAQGADFCFRLAVGSWACAQRFVASQAREQILWLDPTPDYRRACQRRGQVARPVRVRLIRVELNTGEVEVLITSLLDSQRYPAEVFGPLYHLRWGVEEQIKVAKCRIEIENWTGKSPEAVRQDFAARILLHNLTRLLGRPAAEELKQRPSSKKHRYQINWTHALGKMKDMAARLLGGPDFRELIPLLHEQFLDNLSCIRPGRSSPRIFKHTRRAYPFAYKPIS